MDELSPVREMFPMGPDWTPFEVWFPPPVLIQAIRPGWDSPVICFPREIPHANTAGLLWRLTGIGKQQIEGLQ